ncbi:MAG: ribose 1,5-bisphosphate isomerase [Desulfurococcales archaeon]|nr:ribose 1,5-bisphosphate isomerase [Desulfurococcales archaeon]
MTCLRRWLGLSKEFKGWEIPEDVVKIREEIRTMVIRGAGKIARAGASALAEAAKAFNGSDVEDFLRYMMAVGEYVKSARPTAVSLPNAVAYVLNRLRKARPSSLGEAVNLVIRSADEFITYSKNSVKIIGELGARRIANGDVVMTHCHSTVAVSVIATAHKHGKVNKVFVKETRPRMQGLITAKALADAGLDVILIPDSSVRYFMKKVNKVVVGADTIAANGAVINKVGTSVVALAAKEARVRTYVAAETYKFSPLTVVGELVPIEIRSPEEVVSKEWLESNPNVRIFNPAFDVTPPEYIDAIITEKGVIPPQAAILILMEEYGLNISDLLTHMVELREDELRE